MGYHPVNGDMLENPTRLFYARVLQVLTDGRVPFLVGGAFALRHYAGIERDTKDMDVFVCESDCPRLFALFDAAGMKAELAFPHWLFKVRSGEYFTDLIFNSGNGLCPVDDLWFRHAEPGELLGYDILYCPAEEAIWQKSFIMERERYDGGDIAHLLRSRAATLDWERLVRRFGPHWRVLYSHLILFGYVYPGHRDAIPAWVTRELEMRLREEAESPPPDQKLCRGTCLSRAQYLVDLEQWDYADARLAPQGSMTNLDTVIWTQGIGS